MDEAQGHPAGDEIRLALGYADEPLPSAIRGVEQIRIVALDGVV